MDDAPNVYEAAQGTTGSAAKDDKPAKGKLMSLDIECTDDDGYIVRETYRSKNKDMYGGPSTKKVASSRAELQAILDDCLGTDAE